MRRTSAATLALVQSILLAGASASAQDAGPTPPPAAGGTNAPVKLPEVLVQGQVEGAYVPASSTAAGFRTQPVLDTPFSISGFTADFIQDTQARTLLDVTRNDPSVTPANDPLWYDRINVRGFYLGVDAVFRDGLAINDQGTIALENKEAIEITKGLSATRNGVTSPGGTLNYVVKRPRPTPLTQLAAFGDGFGGFGGAADFSRRFGKDDRFGVRFNLAAEELRSFVDPVEGERVLAAGAFDWHATERLHLEAELEFHDKEITSANGLAIWNFPSEADARAMLPRLDAEIRSTQPWAMEPNTQLYYSGRATYAFSDDWRVRVAAQRAELERDQRAPSAENIQPNGDHEVWLYYAPNQERNNTALRLVLEGDFETGPLRHELAAGGDFIRRDMIWDDGYYEQIGVGNLFNPSFIPDPMPVTGPAYLGFRSDQLSAFLSDTIHLGDHFQVFGGGRLTHLENFEGSGPGVREETYDKHVFNPTAGLVVKPLPKLALYGSYAEGIEQGGTAPVGTTNAGRVLDPLESDQFELGAKFELPGGAFLTLAAFRIDKGLEYIDGANTYVQDGRQVHDGVELSIGGPVSENLRVIAGAAWLHAEIEETDDPGLIGMRPQGVPEWQANVYADYDLSALLPGIGINAGVYYTGQKPIDAYETWMADSYVRFDAGLRYRHRLGEHASATWRFNVENLSDEVYLSNTTFGYLQFGAPRTFKFSVAFDF